MNRLVVLMCFWLMNAHAVEYVPLQEADLSNPALKITFNDEGQWLEITASEWQDVVYTKEGKQSFLYQVGYDYSKEKGFLRTYSPDMKLVSEVYDTKTGGMVSREELMVAFEIFKDNPVIRPVLAEQSEPVNIFGGFGYADEQPEKACYFGKRCVHVFAHTENKSLIAHAIVRLNDRSVPYPDFDGINNNKEVKK